MSSEVETKPISPTGDGELVHDSEEYESAEEIDGGEYEEEAEEIEGEDEGEEDSEAGEESTDKALDDDEDRKNPQFIPKKGYFYEHDDRMHGEGEEETPAQPIIKKEEKPKNEGKVISDRWSHDLYDENEQTPKSHAELEERYGYDIRGEDMAPRAQRKRLYGRGPTKYTRKWEEEEAYQRPRGGFRGRRSVTRGREFHQPAGRGSKNYDEDFPQLEEKNKKQLDEKNKTPRNNTERNRGGRRGSGAPTHPRRSEWDYNNEDRDRSYGRGGRGNRGGGPRRNEFTNRNRYLDRGSGPPEPNNSSQPKTRDEREWVDKAKRVQDNPQKQANGAFPAKSSDSPFSSKPSGYNNFVKPQETKKSTHPFTNTEYTGSASLTAQRNQDAKLNSQTETEQTGNRDDSADDKGRRPSSTQNNAGRNPTPSKMQQQQQLPETAKPKRFSSQKPKQDLSTTTSATSSTSSVHTPAFVTSSNIVTQTVSSLTTQSQIVAGTVPVTVMARYPPTTLHPQAYYEQVAVPMPTNYEAQNYEAAGSPITVPISAYSTSPYPSPPTGVPPPVQPGVDPSAYITSPQPQIFAPPPHPHPQFISDPTIINFVPPGPPPNYGVPFHSQGYQGFPQVNPGPPELYHGGVTYYSPQNQLQRPHMMVPTKRPKSVLQLVEPPKRDMRQGPRPHFTPQEESLLMTDLYLHQYREESAPHVVDYLNMGPSPNALKQSSGPTSRIIEQHLAQKFEESISLQPKTERVKKSPSPAPLDLTESKSWADQMAEITTPTSPADKTPSFVTGSTGKSEGSSTASATETTKPE